MAGHGTANGPDPFRGRSVQQSFGPNFFGRRALTIFSLAWQLVSPVLLVSAPKISAMWFDASERMIATAIGTFCYFVGVGAAYL